jgi:hypothetical protein
MHATYLIYLIHLELIYLLIFGGECKLRNSPLLNFLHSTFTSSRFDRNTLLSPLFSNNLSLCLSLNFRG